jgi:hypothetical protein
MQPADSVDAFETFAAARGVSIIGITPHEGIAQMLAFYESVAAQGCAKDSGDMLLFQWGTFDWGQGEHFELNITRKFIESASEAPDQLEAFRAFVLSSPALAAVPRATAPAVALRHSYV